MPSDIDGLQITQDITDSITRTYEGVLSPGTVQRLVAESFAELAGEAKITDFLPLLTERLVAERVRSVVRPSRLPPAALPVVLLVGPARDGLGALAAALFRRLGEGRVHVRLAGPPGPVSPSPLVAAAARVAGVDVSGHAAEELEEAAVHGADVLVTLTADDACPIVAGKRYVDWRLDASGGDHADDPAALLDDIHSRASELLAELRAKRSRHRVIIPL